MVPERRSTRLQESKAKTVTSLFNQRNPNIKWVNIVEGNQQPLTFYIRVQDKDKGFGLQCAADFHCTRKNEIIMVGPKPHENEHNGEGKGHIFPFNYQFGAFYGKTQMVLYAAQSGFMDPNQALALVNAAPTKKQANCKFGSSGKHAVLRSTKANYTIEKGEWLAVGPYAPSGSLSGHGMKKESKRKQQQQHDLDTKRKRAQKQAGIGKTICSKCGLVLHYKKEVIAHRFVCKG